MNKQDIKNAIDRLEPDKEMEYRLLRKIQQRNNKKFRIDEIGVEFMKFIKVKHISLSIWLVGVLVVGFFLSGKYLFDKQIIREVELSGNIVIMRYEELYEYVDLIIVGKPLDNIEDAKPLLNYSQYENYASISSFASYRNIEVQKVIKGELDDKKITILEAAAITNDDTGKVLLMGEGYYPMQKNKRYVLFLKKNTQGEYSIHAVNQGKFNVDNDDQKEYEKSEMTSDQYKKLKSDVLNKLSDKIQF